MFTDNELKKEIGKRHVKFIEDFVELLCEDYKDCFGDPPTDDVGFSMIRLFESLLCDYTKREEEPDVEPAFDPTDFHTICRLGGYRDLPPVHPGRKRSDGNLRNVGCKNNW